MRNAFLFIRRHFNFLFFVVLQIIALSFLFRFNKFHEAAFLNVSTEVTGRLDEKYNNIEYYFQLKKTNEALVQENLRLRQQLKEKNCGISMYEYSRERLNELQSKLAFCDGLMVSYSVETKSWAEDAMSEAFQLRRSEERPLAFAAVGLSPLPDSEFNFEHPRVVSMRSTPTGSFEGMTQFLEKLQEQYA